MGIINCILVDDERNSRELLKQMISENAPNFRVIDEAENVKQAIARIADRKPQLVLLDIEMTDGNGFDVLSVFPNPSFKVIFITGYDQFAIKAFKYAAIDYILKPVSEQELMAALQRAADVTEPNWEQINFLKSQMKDGTTLNAKQLIISQNTGFSFLQFDEIRLVEGSGNYVYFHTTDGNKKLVTHNIGYFEELLPENLFFRVHKSYIVNLSKVKKYESGRGGALILDNGEKIDVAQRRKSTLLSYLKAFGR